MPGYVQRLVERAAPLLGLSIEGTVSTGFTLKPQRPGAMDHIAPEIETYPIEARQRLMVQRPSVGQAAVWLHPGEPVFDALARGVLETFGSEAMRGGIYTA